VARVLLFKKSHIWKKPEPANNKGFGGAKHTQKFIPRTPNHFPSLWLTTILHVSSIEPTLVHITLRTMSTALAVHIVPRQQHQTADSKAVTTTTGEGRKFFFPPTNRFSDLSPNNIQQVIQHYSVTVILLSFFF
jgi:hypothetical protein